jgi:heme ABC exporter ATP-binding subunit CcmA
VIRIENLTATYGRTLALDDITIEIGPGVTGLFGPNGSGKSTLLRILAGLLRPRSGTLSLGGGTISLSSESFRGKVGYAGHEPGLYPHLSVAENLRLFGLLHGAPERRVDEMIDALGLRDYAAVHARDLSAGLRRRAGVARALVHDPEILLLDEPYANLDDEASDALSGALTQRRGGHRICIVATHGAKRVKSFADAGIIIQRGRIISHRVRVPEGAET